MNTCLTYGYASDEAMEEGARAAQLQPSSSGRNVRVQLDLSEILARGKKGSNKAKTRCPKNAGSGFTNEPTKHPTHSSTFVARGTLSIAQTKRMLDVGWVVKRSRKNG